MSKIKAKLIAEQSKKSFEDELNKYLEEIPDNMTAEVQYQHNQDEHSDTYSALILTEPVHVINQAE